MKKLFLSGGGDKEELEFHKKFFDLLPNKRFIYIPVAMEGSKKHPYPKCYEWIMNTFSEVAEGSKFKIEMITDLSKVDLEYLKSFDGIYIGGGNTYKLLRNIKNTGFGAILKEFLQNYGPIYGESAGAIISKELFDQVRDRIIEITPKKSKWGAKKFTYKGLFRCGNCKSYVIGEERYRERKNGKQPRKHIYYHCTRQKDHTCTEPYVSVEDLEKSLIRFIDFVYINHPNKITYTEKLQTSIQKYKELRDEVLLQQNISPNSKVWDIRDYTRYVMRYGKPEMKRELFKMFDYDFYLKNKQVTTLRAH